VAPLIENTRSTSLPRGWNCSLCHVRPSRRSIMSDPPAAILFTSRSLSANSISPRDFIVKLLQKFEWQILTVFDSPIRDPE
jgi:hypothetical protein